MQSHGSFWARIFWFPYLNQTLMVTHLGLLYNPNLDQKGGLRILREKNTIEEQGRWREQGISFKIQDFNPNS